MKLCISSRNVGNFDINLAKHLADAFGRSENAQPLGVTVHQLYTENSCGHDLLSFIQCIGKNTIFSGIFGNKLNLTASNLISFLHQSTSFQIYTLTFPENIMLVNVYFFYDFFLSVCWFVDRSVCRLVGRSVIISLGGKFPSTILSGHMFYFIAQPLCLYAQFQYYNILYGKALAIISLCSH